MHIIFLNGLWPNIETNEVSQYTRTFSCYALKHWLSHFDISSKVIDYCQLLSHEEIIKLLDTFIDKETCIIGISTTFWPISDTIPKNIQSTITYIKETYPNIKIISGGARTTRFPIFDKVFIGESEDSLLEYVKSLLGKNYFPFKKFNIVEQNFLFNKDDSIIPGEALPLELGRGCIFKCKFCSHHNLGKPKFTYQRKFENIIKEIEHNKSTFNVNKYIFLDDTVNEDLDKIRNLSKIKDITGIDIQWVGYLRADLLWSKPESIELLKKSGLISCFFGIETFNPLSGKSIDKGWGAKHGKKFLPYLYDYWGEEITIHSNFIAGLPYETIESLNDTLDWCLNNNIGSYRFAPLTLYTEKSDEYTQSEFTRHYKDYGYKNVSNDGYWETDTLTRNTATDFSIRANAQLFRKNKITNWFLMSALNLGYNISEIKTWNHSDLLLYSTKKKEIFKSKYIENLTNH